VSLPQTLKMRKTRVRHVALNQKLKRIKSNFVERLGWKITITFTESRRKTLFPCGL